MLPPLTPCPRGGRNDGGGGGGGTQQKKDSLRLNNYTTQTASGASTAQG